MKLARVFVGEYPGRNIGDIFDVIDSNNHPGTLLSGTIKEVEVGDDFDKDVMTAKIAEDQSVSFELDSTKVTAKQNLARSMKLQALRSMRAARLVEVDVLVNDIVLKDSSLTAEVLKDYRQALKDVTNPFKKYESDDEHASAVDKLELDSFKWPEKPL